MLVTGDGAVEINVSFIGMNSFSQFVFDVFPHKSPLYQHTKNITLIILGTGHIQYNYVCRYDGTRNIQERKMEELPIMGSSFSLKKNFCFVQIYFSVDPFCPCLKSHLKSFYTIHVFHYLAVYLFDEIPSTKNIHNSKFQTSIISKDNDDEISIVFTVVLPPSSTTITNY